MNVYSKLRVKITPRSCLFRHFFIQDITSSSFQLSETFFQRINFANLSNQVNNSELDDFINHLNENFNVEDSVIDSEHGCTQVDSIADDNKQVDEGNLCFYML